MYCASIYLTSSVGMNEEYDTLYDIEYFDRTRLFGSNMRTMLTLFQIITLDSWTTIVRPIVEGPQPALLLFFVLFIFFTAFGLLSILIGVLADNVLKSSERNEEISERLMQDDR